MKKVWDLNIYICLISHTQVYRINSRCYYKQQILFEAFSRQFSLLLVHQEHQQ